MGSFGRVSARTLGTAAVALLAIAPVGACGTCTATWAPVSCAGPVLTVAQTSVRAGEEIRVSGQYFVDGCADVADQCGPLEEETPLTAVPLTIFSGTVSGAERSGKEAGTVLARLDATGESGQIDASVTIPRSVTAGKATLQLGDAEPVVITVT